jgi:hypothetical protein
MIICHRQQISETEGMSPSLFPDCEKVVFTLKSSANGWSSEVEIAEASKLFVFLFYLIDSYG